MTNSQTLSFNGIEWEILPTVTAKKMYALLQDNLDTCREFYFMGETEQEIKDEIDKIVYMLGKEPTDDLNKLHEYFADNEHQPEMERLNNLIHYYELVRNDYPPRWGYFPGEDNGSEEFLSSFDYATFTLQRNPGWLYVNYAHVGKHFAEIVFSNDVDIKEEQYEPQYLMRPSFFCWLGQEIGEEQVNRFNIKAKEIHEKLQDRLNLPDFDDPSLRLGYIPFAKLKTHININELSNMLLKQKGKNTKYMELFNARQRRV